MRVLFLLIYNMKYFTPILLFTSVLYAEFSYSQGCCSGGSGSPIAGGVSAGVLLERQMEIATNFQFLNSDKFKTKNRDTTQLFDHYNSKYFYSKIAYGVTKDFTMSVETGYYLNKTQIGLKDTMDLPLDTIQSSGMGDLILFPRYDILNNTSETKRTEITLGLGFKIPLGKHNDSAIAYTNPNTGQNIYTTSPPLIQPTNGSQDIIFYAFFYRGYPLKKIRFFANTLYIKKGWNSLGQKFGNYSSVGLFAGKTFFENLGVTIQLKGEIIDSMRYDKNIDMLALYNIDVKSTGSKRILLAPQINYTIRSFTFFALSEIPLYEYVKGTQLAAQHQFTIGVSYRFFTVNSKIPKSGEDVYMCSMKCAKGISNKPGKCRVCGMELQKE